MVKIPKRFAERAKPALRKYQKILAGARERDVNESDTVVVCVDFLTEVLGYDKYEEITTELAIRGTYCDLAIKTDGRIRFLIEVKAIGTTLNDNHLRQATDYGAKQGVDWVILTNGATWQAHRLKFEKPVEHEKVFEVDLLEDAKKPAEILELLFLLSKEALSAGAIEKYRERAEATDRFVLAQLCLSDPILSSIRRELRRISPGLRISTDEIRTSLERDVLKREVVADERAKTARARVRRAASKKLRLGASDVSDKVPSD